MPLPAVIDSTLSWSDHKNNRHGPFAIPRAVIVQSQGTSDYNIGHSSASGQQVGQSILHSSGISMQKVTFWLKKVGGPTDTLLVDLCASGFSPGSVIATSEAVAASSLTTAYKPITFTFSSPQTLSANTSYWFVVRRTGANDTTNYYHCLVSGSDPYVDGKSGRFLTSWAFTTNADLAFAVHDNDTTDLYVVLLDKTNNHAECWKSIDGGETWSEQDATNHPSIRNVVGNKSIDVFLLGLTLYVAFIATSGPTAVISFTCTTNTWGTVSSGTGPIISPTDGITSTGTFFLRVRSNGDYVVLHQGPMERVMGTDYRRVVYSRYDGSTWVNNVAIDAAGQIHYDARSATHGSSDRTHFFYSNSSVTALRHRSLSSVNVLDTEGGTATSHNVAAQYPIGTPLLLGSSVLVPRPINGNTQIQVERATSAANPTWAAEAVSTSAAEITNSNPIALAAVGTTVHAFWPDDDMQDLWRDSDGGTGTWGTDTEFLDAVTINGINVGTITNAIGVLYDNGGTVTYSKLSLGATTHQGAAPFSAVTDYVAAASTLQQGVLTVDAVTNYTPIGTRVRFGTLTLDAVTNYASLGTRVRFGTLLADASTDYTIAAQRLRHALLSLDAEGTATFTVTQEAIQGSVAFDALTDFVAVGSLFRQLIVISDSLRGTLILQNLSGQGVYVGGPNVTATTGLYVENGAILQNVTFNGAIYAVGVSGDAIDVRYIDAEEVSDILTGQATFSALSDAVFNGHALFVNSLLLDAVTETSLIGIAQRSGAVTYDANTALLASATRTRSANLIFDSTTDASLIGTALLNSAFISSADFDGSINGLLLRGGILTLSSEGVLTVVPTKTAQSTLSLSALTDLALTYTAIRQASLNVSADSDFIGNPTALFTGGLTFDADGAFSGNALRIRGTDLSLSAAADLVLVPVYQAYGGLFVDSVSNAIFASSSFTTHQGAIILDALTNLTVVPTALRRADLTLSADTEFSGAAVGLYRGLSVFEATTDLALPTSQVIRSTALVVSAEGTLTAVPVAIRRSGLTLDASTDISVAGLRQQGASIVFDAATNASFIGGALYVNALTWSAISNLDLITFIPLIAPPAIFRTEQAAPIALVRDEHGAFVALLLAEHVISVGATQGEHVLPNAVLLAERVIPIVGFHEERPVPLSVTDEEDIVPLAIIRTDAGTPAVP